MENESIEQKEKIKLMKMSKGYQWEISLLANMVDSSTISRLEFLDNQLKEKWGDKEEK